MKFQVNELNKKSFNKYLMVMQVMACQDIMSQGKGRYKGLKRVQESIRGERGVQDEPEETIRETGRYKWYH